MGPPRWNSQANWEDLGLGVRRSSVSITLVQAGAPGAEYGQLSLPPLPPRASRGRQKPSVQLYFPAGGWGKGAGGRVTC